MDLNEQIETTQLHVRALVERLRGIGIVNDRERAQLAALMLWCDRAAEQAEDLAEARKVKFRK